MIVDWKREEFQEEFENICRDIARHANIPGFRRGKAPQTLIRKKYAAPIQEELGNQLASKSYQEALDSQKIKPISSPILERFTMEDGGDAHLEIAFDVLPAIDLQEYKGLRVEVNRATVTEELLESSLKSIQERCARFLPVTDRSAEVGDHINADFKGKLTDGSGVEFQDKSVSLELGGTNVQPEFTENLKGTKPGDSRTFIVSYPKDFQNPRMAGKEVQYQVDVLVIHKKELPPIDDNLAKETGEHQTLEGLKRDLTDTMQANMDREYENTVRNKLFEALTKQYSFEPPSTMVEESLHDSLTSFAYGLSQQGVDPNRLNLDWRKVAENSRPKATETARGNVLLEKVAEKEGITISAEELDAEVVSLSKYSEKNFDAFRADLEKKGRLEPLRLQLLHRKTLDFLREHAVIESVEITKLAGE